MTEESFRREDARVPTGRSRYTRLGKCTRAAIELSRVRHCVYTLHWTSRKQTKCLRPGKNAHPANKGGAPLRIPRGCRFTVYRNFRHFYQLLTHKKRLENSAERLPFRNLP